MCTTTISEQFILLRHMLPHITSQCIATQYLFYWYSVMFHAAQHVALQYHFATCIAVKYRFMSASKHASLNARSEILIDFDGEEFLAK